MWYRFRLTLHFKKNILQHIYQVVHTDGAEYRRKQDLIIDTFYFRRTFDVIDKSTKHSTTADCEQRDLPSSNTIAPRQSCYSDKNRWLLYFEGWRRKHYNLFSPIVVLCSAL